MNLEKKPSWVHLLKRIENIIFILIRNILKNVPNQNKKYVKNQLARLNKNFMDYMCYWNEKYYRNGFCDGSLLVIGYFDE